MITAVVAAVQQWRGSQPACITEQCSWWGYSMRPYGVVFLTMLAIYRHDPDILELDLTWKKAREDLQTCCCNLGLALAGWGGGC